MNARETAIISGALMVQHATVFATNIVIGRDLGPGALGEISVLRSIASILLIVTPLGLDLALLKHASLYRDRPAELRGLALALRLLVATVNLSLLALLAFWLGPFLDGVYEEITGFRGLLVVTVAGVVFAADLQLSGAFYRAADRTAAYFVVTNYVQATLRMAFSVCAIWAGGGVMAVVTVNAVVAVATVALLELDQRRTRGVAAGRSFQGIAAAASTILRESVWMCGALLLYSLMRLLDLLLLGALASPAATGQYAAMSMVAQVIAIYPGAISQTLGPSIAMLHAAGNREGMRQEIAAYLRKATLLGGFLLGGIAVFGTDLDLVFGSRFAFPIPLVVLLSVGWYVSAVLAPLGYVLSMTGRHREELAVLAVGTVLLAVMLPSLIPWLGGVGAALAVAAAFVLVNVLRAVRVIAVLGSNPLRWTHALPPAVFVAAALACRLLGQWWVGRSFGTLVAECSLYALLALALFLAAFARPEERAAARRALRL